MRCSSACSSRWPTSSPPTNSVNRPTCRPLIDTSANSRNVLAANSNDGSTVPAWVILARTDGLDPWASSRGAGRWGEKVPAAGRAVGLGLVQRHRGPAGDSGAGPTLERARPLTGGAEQLDGQPTGLLLGEVFHGAFDQTGGGAAASCPISSKSVSSGGPSGPYAFRATIFPHCLANSFTAANRSSDDLRVGIGRPALHLGRTPAG